jgi:hypothetical protein
MYCKILIAQFYEKREIAIRLRSEEGEERVEEEGEKKKKKKNKCYLPDTISFLADFMGKHKRARSTYNLNATLMENVEDKLLFRKMRNQLKKSNSLLKVRTHINIVMRSKHPRISKHPNYCQLHAEYQGS